MENIEFLNQDLKQTETNPQMDELMAQCLTPTTAAVGTPTCTNGESQQMLSSTVTGPASTTNRIVPNPIDTSFSRVVLTDWLVYSGCGDCPKSEILEFAWAVYDLSSESLLEKVRYIIRPTENDRNTISRETLQKLKLNDPRPLEHSKTLQQVLSEFDSACSMVAPPSVCVVVGAAKLRDQLLSETFRKGLTVPKCLRGVLDLATLASHFYPAQFSGLSQQELVSPRIIATLLGATLPTTAEEFASMDGCVLMSASIKKMHGDNISFQPQHLSTVITGPEPSPVQQQQQSTPSGDLQDHVIKLRGVPWDATAREIIRFVEPVGRISSEDIHIVTNLEGRSSGEAFVRLSSMALRDKCLSDLHGKHIGKRWIEVFKASEADVSCFASFKESELLERRGALRLRGLPYSTNEYEVVKFFTEGGFPIVINSVVLSQSRENRLSGDAWVLFESPQVAEEAKRALHKKTIGKRYIELFHASPREAEMARKGHSMPPGRMLHAERPSPYESNGWTPPPSRYSAPYHGGGNVPIYSTPSSAPVLPPTVYQTHGINPGGMKASGGFPADKGPVHSPVLRMRGLPYYANENHIVEFFNGLAMAAILPATAPIEGRPTGEAYVEFISVDEAWRAIKTRQGAMMDRRYIELFPATKQEMELAAAGLDPRTATANTTTTRSTPVVHRVPNAQ